MNAIKNTIVTVTLLIVGYGAYKVLKNPPADTLDKDLLSWSSNDAEELSAPKAELQETETLTISNQRNDLISRIGTPSGGSAADDSSSDLPNNDESLVYSSEVHDDPGFDPDAGVSAFDSEENVVSDLVAENLSSTDLATAQDSELVIPQDDLSLPSNDDQSYYDREGTPSPENDLVNASNTANQDLLTVENETTANDEFEIIWQQASEQLENGSLANALETLTRFYQKGTFSSAQAEKLLPLLDQLAGTVIYSNKSFVEPAYQVQAGDTLVDISKKYQLNVEFLARINGVASNYQPVSGESMKVIRGPFHAVVDRVQNHIILYIGNYYAGRFNARFGNEFPTTSGTFQVIEKTAGREFFDTKSGYRVPSGDTRNPYGAYWIGLRGEQVTAGHNVGIHVATGPENLGCIGVNEVDANDLTAILSNRSQVVIK